MAMTPPNGWVILGKTKGHNSYTTGVVERSFSMDVANGRTNLFWYGTAYSNFGSIHELTPESVKKAADKYRDMFSASHPDQEFEVWDLKDPHLPVEFDWREYEEAGQPAQSLSGVRDKFKRRNPRFEMK